MKITPPNTQSFNGKTIQPGEFCEVSAADGEALIAEGWIPADGSEPEPEEIEADEPEDMEI